MALDIPRRHDLTGNSCFSGSYNVCALSSTMIPSLWFRICVTDLSFGTTLHCWLFVGSGRASIYCIRAVSFLKDEAYIHLWAYGEFQNVVGDYASLVKW